VELYPAVDVQGGRVARATAAAVDAHPLAVVEHFARAGARWIHFVDLDRAFGRGENRALARAVLGAVPPPLRVQVGGNLDAEGVDEMLAWGAARAVIGTTAALNAAVVDRLVARYGAERLAVAIDVRDGRVAARGEPGPRAAATVRPIDLARRVRSQGVRTVIYADGSRDGQLAGADLAGARAVAAVEGGLEVIASGGVASLDDVRAARAAGLAGVVVGRALLEAQFTLAEALACVA
jgi:phosphoribosylformimino-5-aminoimidazole carboxamide ribonucleotide (ProFAR) isomerase